MKLEQLDDLFLMTLEDIYGGEKQILKALPKMVGKATNPELRDALKQHRVETADQVDRLEQIFKALGKKPKSETCEAIEGLIAEGQEVMTAAKDDAVRDAGIIAAGQAIEHYEIARYGTLVAWAEQLGLEEAVPLLEQTLEEEKKADATLNRCALEGANERATA